MTGGLDASSRRWIGVRREIVRVHRRLVSAGLLAFAALDEHRGEAGDADGQHAEDGELHPRAAFVLLQQGALWNEWIGIVHCLGAVASFQFEGWY